MKRVLCVVASLNIGGAETFLMKVLRSIDKSKYMLDFIVSAPGVYDDEVKSLGGRIYTVPLRTEHPIKTFHQIRCIVKNNKYQFFLKLCDTPMGVMDLVSAKLGGAKWIVVRSCNASSNTSKKKEIIYSVLRPVFNALSDCKVAPSDLAAEYTFGKKSFEKGEVKKLNNGVDLSVYKFDAEGRSSVRSEFFISEDTVLVGHIGRFNQQKNHKFLIDVFCDFHKQNPNSKLMLVGTGELTSQVYSKVERLGLESRVVFTGIRKDIPQLLSAMDIFLLPSFYEGMPNTVIEAQATGLRCIVSDRITREANITGKVDYLPIGSDFKIWVNLMMNGIEKKRFDTYDIFRKSGFGMEETVETFIEYIFH